MTRPGLDDTAGSMMKAEGDDNPGSSLRGAQRRGNPCLRVVLICFQICSGQSAFPNRLDSPRRCRSSAACSGQSAFPNRLDSCSTAWLILTCSGQSAFPNRLDSKRVIAEVERKFRSERISQSTRLVTSSSRITVEFRSERISQSTRLLGPNANAMVKFRSERISQSTRLDCRRGLSS